eukprot:403360678
MNLHLTNLYVFYYPIFLLGVYYSTIAAFWTTLFKGFVSGNWITTFPTEYASFYSTIITNFLQ